MAVCNRDRQLSACGLAIFSSDMFAKTFLWCGSPHLTSQSGEL